MKYWPLCIAKVNTSCTNHCVLTIDVQAGKTWHWQKVSVCHKGRCQGIFSNKGNAKTLYMKVRWFKRRKLSIELNNCSFLYNKRYHKGIGRYFRMCRFDGNYFIILSSTYKSDLFLKWSLTYVSWWPN